MPAACEGSNITMLTRNNYWRINIIMVTLPPRMTATHRGFHVRQAGTAFDRYCLQSGTGCAASIAPALTWVALFHVFLKVLPMTVVSFCATTHFIGRHLTRLLLR